MTKTLTAAAVGLAPLRPPKRWFDDPKLAGPTALTVTSDGRVYGHAALWDSCHVGYGGRCVTPPRSSSGYSHFHLGALEAADGSEVAVGKVTLGCGHAATASGVSEAQARAHYDDTGTVAAYVRAGEDRFGIWLAGAVRPDLPAEKLVELRGNPISGDWRGGELIAATCVPTPGFPVPRQRVVAAAYDRGEEVALVASFAPAVVFAKPDPERIARLKAALDRFKPGVHAATQRKRTATKRGSSPRKAGLMIGMDLVPLVEEQRAMAAAPANTLIAHSDAIDADAQEVIVLRRGVVDHIEKRRPR